jgi:hypothetical protein
MKVSLDKKYQTRDGKKVTLYAIKGLTTFPVKGALLHTTQSGRTKRDYQIWKIDGRFNAIGESYLDLVEVTP